jgi:hypothetical protein
MVQRISLILLVFLISLNLFSLPAHAGFFEDLGGLFNRDRGDDDRDTDDAKGSDLSTAPRNGVRIVIDRAPDAQEMRIYPENSDVAKICPVTTGRETFDMPTNFKRNAGCSETEKSNAGEPFHIQNLVRDHRSDTWYHKDEATGEMVGSEMPYSTFFNGGIAIHVASGEGLLNLGPKAHDGKDKIMARDGSGGCVRTNEECAKYVMDMFAKTTTKDGTTDYQRQDMTNVDYCRNNTPPPPRCTDPDQMPLVYNRRPVSIEVVDSRPAEEQERVRLQCATFQDMYRQTKLACLAAKLREEGKTVDEAAANSTPESRRDFVNKYAGTKKNEECNRQLYYEHAVAKCKLGEIIKANKRRTTVNPNDGMFDMEKVQEIFAKQRQDVMNKAEQYCAAFVQDMMYVSPSDPDARPAVVTPETAPIPRPRPTHR